MAAVADGLELNWAQEHTADKRFGGSYVAYMGSRVIFSCGTEQAFNHLYDQAKIAAAAKKKLAPKELAVKLLQVLSDQPHGALYLLRKAEAGDSYLEMALSVLGKLASAGKVKQVMFEGKKRWRTV
jgi:hypothetical protein